MYVIDYHCYSDSSFSSVRSTLTANPIDVNHLTIKVLGSNPGRTRVLKTKENIVRNLVFSYAVSLVRIIFPEIFPMEKNT